MSDLLTKHPDLQGVWCANGGSASGAMAALKSEGKQPGKDVQVVAMDMNVENLESLRAGELLFDTGGHWMQGGFALVLLFDHLQGLPVPKRMSQNKIPLLPLTRKTLPLWDREFADGYTSYDFRKHSRFYTPQSTSPVVPIQFSGSFTPAP
jgi:simple sugar transport system substrate-binding protein